MPKFLGTLRVIVEAEDWNEAFDYLDELTKVDMSWTDAKILTSNIDYLRKTKGSRVGEKMSKRDLIAAGMKG